MEKKIRHTYADLVAALEHDKAKTDQMAISYSATLAMHSVLLISMSIADGYHSPVEYANNMTGREYTLYEMHSYVKAAEKLHMGLCTADKLRWIAYYAKYVEDHEGAMHPKPSWNLVRRLAQAWCKTEKAKFVAWGKNND